MANNVWMYLSARVGNQWYGIEVDKVIEVVHLVAFTELFTVREDILGLITIRDEVMPLVDMRRRFGIKDAPLKLDTPIVAIREANGALALLFDDTDRVEAISYAQVTTAQDTQQLPSIRAVAKLSGHLLLLLDTSLISKEIRALSNPT